MEKAMTKPANPSADKYEGCVCLQDDHNTNCPAILTGRCHFQSLYKAESADREAPQDGIERAREWLHAHNIDDAVEAELACMATYAASEVSRVRRETLEEAYAIVDQCLTAKDALSSIRSLLDVQEEGK
jgi:hypothetical protein